MNLFRRNDITDISGESVYLSRWSLWLPFGWSLKLHCIRRADDDRCQHDHPWGFWTLILRGGYDELVGIEQTLNRMRPGRLAWRSARFRHRIILLPKGRAWTMVLTRQKEREWGFYTRGGWMHWREFVNASRSKRVLWCHDGSKRSDPPNRSET